MVKIKYLDGYHSGKAEKLQQDWERENPPRDDYLQCKAPMLDVDPFVFTPVGYKQVSEDIFELK